MKSESVIADQIIGCLDTECDSHQWSELKAIIHDIRKDAMTCPPLDKQLLTDLEAWRAYLRILLDRLTPGGTSLERDALKAWSIADDALALSLNKAIGEK